MKKNFTKIISVLLVLIMIASVMSISTFNASAATYSGTCGDNLTWTFDESTGELVISGTGAMYDYDYYNTPWKYKKSSIKTITVLDDVTRIGDCAFHGCQNLTNIKFSDSVTIIGKLAFENCNSLTNVIIGNGVNVIGERAFEDCDFLTNVTIGNSVITIDDCAFQRCQKLTNITFSESVTKIGDNAFGYCTSLTNVIVPDSVIQIGSYAFYDCANLTNVKLGDQINVVGDYAFSDCDSLVNVTFGNSIIEIGNYAFCRCVSLTNLTLGDRVETIGDYAFSYCDNLMDVTIGNGVTIIGNGAFCSCGNITNITIGNSVSTIGSFAFHGCSSLKTIEIPDSVISIGYQAFSYCYSLKELKFPVSTKIYNSSYTFYSCTNIEKVFFTKGSGIPQNFTTDTESVDTCYGYTPWNTSRDNLKEIVIEEDVTSVGNYMFFDCYNLTNIIIPNSVTSIGYYAFYNCDNIKDVYFCGTQKEWKNIDFGEYNESLLNATIHYNYCPHSYDFVVIAPTCEDQGYTTYTCECGDSYVADYVDATGHSHTAEVTTPATHTSTGVMTYTCSCGDTYTEKINKIADHEFEARVTDPTCTEQGYTTFICTCGESYTRDYVNAKGHTAGDWVVTTPATTATSGVKTLYCASCETVLATQVIPATGKVSSVAISDLSLDYKASTTITPSITVDSGVKYTVTYSSSDPSVASIDANGKVSTGKTGSATITVTVTDEFGNTVSDTCEVKVNYNWWQWIIVVVFFGWIWY